eukprot:g8220.t1
MHGKVLYEYITSDVVDGDHLSRKVVEQLTVLLNLKTSFTMDSLGTAIDQVYDTVTALRKDDKARRAAVQVDFDPWESDIVNRASVDAILTKMFDQHEDLLEFVLQDQRRASTGTILGRPDKGLGRHMRTKASKTAFRQQLVEFVQTKIHASTVRSKANLPISASVKEFKAMQRRVLESEKKTEAMAETLAALQIDSGTTIKKMNIPGSESRARVLWK